MTRKKQTKEKRNESTNFKLCVLTCMLCRLLLVPWRGRLRRRRPVVVVAAVVVGGGHEALGLLAKDLADLHGEDLVNFLKIFQ